VFTLSWWHSVVFTRLPILLLLMLKLLLLLRLKLLLLLVVVVTVFNACLIYQMPHLNALILVVVRSIPKTRMDWRFT
jgi:hypothetical protein